MVDTLLDSATIVDLLRVHPPAVNWFATQNQTFGVTKFVWMEMIRGCDNNQELHKVTKQLKKFELVKIKATDIDWALDKLTAFYLSHNIDIMDCLIAATAYRLQIPIYTRNLKHFTPLLGKLAQKPY